MNYKDYLKTWTWLQTENRWGRAIQMGLLISVILLAAKSFTKETIVTVTPFTLTEDAWIGEKTASKSYKEAWAFAFATILGNVTPASVDFIGERIKPFLSPRVYQDVVDVLRIQATQIKEDRVSMRFEPRTVEYEAARDKIYVYGNSFMKGANNKESREDRTYEFEISVQRYAPMVSYIDTYKGRPRTKTVLERMGRKEEQQKINDERNSQYMDALDLVREQSNEVE